MKQSSTKLVPVAVYLLIVTSYRYNVSATEFTEFFDNYDGSGWSNESVFTEVEESEEYVMPSLLKVTWWILYLPTGVFGCVGNTAVVLAEFRNPISKSGSRCLLVQMCVLDVVTSIILIFPDFVQTVTENWPFGPVFCAIMYATSAPILTSMLSISALALKRFLCFIRPGKRPMTSWFAWKLIAAMWIFSVSLFLPDILFHKLATFQYYGCNITVCVDEWPVGLHQQRMIHKIFEVSPHIILLLVAVILIGYLYVQLGQLQCHSRATEQDIHLVPSNLFENRKIFILTDVLVFGLAACELPFLIRQAQVYILESSHGNVHLYLLLTWLFSCKVVICPITYISLYKRNSDELQQKNGIKSGSGCNVQPQNGNERYSTSTI